MGGVELDLSGGAVFWKATLVELESHVFLGAIGNARPEDVSYKDPTAFGWYSGTSVFIAVKDASGHGGWANNNLKQSDVCVFKLEPEKLSARVQRLGDRTFSVSTNGQRGLRAWVSVHNGGRVRLSAAGPHEEYH